MAAILSSGVRCSITCSRRSGHDRSHGSRQVTGHNRRAEALSISGGGRRPAGRHSCWAFATIIGQCSDRPCRQRPYKTWRTHRQQRPDQGEGGREGGESEGETAEGETGPVRLVGLHLQPANREPDRQHGNSTGPHGSGTDIQISGTGTHGVSRCLIFECHQSLVLEL